MQSLYLALYAIALVLTDSKLCKQPKNYCFRQFLVGYELLDLINDDTAPPIKTAF
jgi:hypothetical protein